MARGIETKLFGRDALLVLAGKVYFDLIEKYGGIIELTDKIRESTAASIEITLDAARMLADQGELIRRKLGYDKREIPTVAEVQEAILSISPLELLNLKTAVNNAIFAGMTREYTPENVDLGLVELQKKTEA